MAALTPSERAVVDKLAQKIRELTLRGRALSYAELDRRLGKGRQGWTRKFLAGPDSPLFPGTPSIGTVLDVLRILNVPVGQFFEDALADQPPPEAGPSDEELLSALAEAMERFQKRFEKHEARIENLEKKETR
jgi:hypothetical protein